MRSSVAPPVEPHWHGDGAAAVNRLAGAVSPYLRQHAANPVDWYQWGEDAFAAARSADLPLFVSIGYAACHWCHVMAHESFEDPVVAEDLRRSFVSVKVDREERPDVDALYMTAVQATTGSGGWPMSVFCTPDGRPFFAGTYFPPTDRHGMPSFRRVLHAVADAWRQRRAEVEGQADALADAVRAEASPVGRLTGSDLGGSSGLPEGAAVLDRLVTDLAARFDPRWGGFSPAPKFPRPTFVELCLRHHRATGAAQSLTMATTTLAAMAAGGIYDHLAGGFARYSTDERWLVPHFEKMLTDQALLARAYLHAWQATGAPEWRQVAAETLDAAWTELGLGPGAAGPGAAGPGALGSSLDADAGGVEGGHATWTPAEVHQAMAEAGRPELAEAVCRWYGIEEGGNWEGRAIPVRPLHGPLRRPPEIEHGRAVLLEARRRRTQPGRDDKVLTEWNAMYAAVLAEAAGACADDAWAGRARSVMESLTATNRRADGRWLRAAGTDVVAFATDLAWVVEACTRLGELTGRAAWTHAATEAADQLLDRCYDTAAGGLFTAGDDADPLIARAKDVLDGAVPSSASVGAQALLRLGALTGSARFTDAGEELVALDAPLLAGQPVAVADMVPSLLFAEAPVEVVVSGDRPDLLSAVRAGWLPGAVVAFGEPTASPLWEGRADGQAAYVCHRSVCLAPAHDPRSLARQLAEAGTR